MGIENGDRRQARENRVSWARSPKRKTLFVSPSTGAAVWRMARTWVVSGLFEEIGKRDDDSHEAKRAFTRMVRGFMVSHSGRDYRKHVQADFAKSKRSEGLPKAMEDNVE